jgi:hypothetical protein
LSESTLRIRTPPPLRGLKRLRSPYPSFADPDHEMADSLKVLGLPDTAFYDGQGQLVFIEQGAYRDDDELEDQIEKLLLEKS